jgi:uncharacterized damage-inducible protein DinB
MATTHQQESTLASFLADRWEQGVKKLAEVAQALPENKLEWTPVAGVRSYGGVLRHVAFWNQYVADSLNGKQANDTLNELPATEYPTKATALEALRRTSQDVVAALRAQPASANGKTLELVLTFLEHNSEHYGQLAVYARLMGIVPPASRA